jgi:hypothetical protein
MSAVPPASAPVPAPPVPPGTQTLPVLRLPAGVSTLLPGNAFAATVTAQTPQGQTLLTSALGDFLLAGRLPFPPGSQVTVLPQQAGGGLQVQVSPGAPTPATPSPAEAGTAPLPQFAGAQQSGQVVGATLARLADGPVPPLPVVGQGVAAGATAPPTAGAALQLRLLPADASAGQTANATVVSATARGVTASGQALVQTDFGLLSVRAAQPPPPGTPLLLEVLGLVRPAPPALPDSVAGNLLAKQWPALEEAVRGLQQHDPGTLQTLLGRAIPQPGPQLGASLLFLFSALRGGDLRNWLGDTAMAALERHSRGALGRLSQDFAHLHQLAQDDPATDWRAFFLPIQTQDRVEQIRMYLRNRRKRKKRDDNATRWIVEADLSQIGPIQIDGLLRPKRVDLVLRTHSPLSDAMQRDIHAIFVGAAEASGFAGTLQFQAVPSFPIDPLQEITRDRGPGLTI